MAATATEQLTLTAVRRETVGTTPSRTLRTQGQVPGVVYGKQMDPIAVILDAKKLVHVLHTEAGEHALLTLRIEAAGPGAKTRGTGKPWERNVLIKAVEHHPVNGHVMHVDFHAIVLTERLKVKVPVELKGEPAGVKEQDGILEHFLREIEVECLPTNIQAGLELEVAHLKIGDSVHVSDLALPPGVELVSDPEGVLASVQAPKEEKEEEEPAAEPEVLTEKKEGEEGAEGEPAKGEAEGKKREKKDEPKGEKKDDKK